MESVPVAEERWTCIEVIMIEATRMPATPYVAIFFASYAIFSFLLLVFGTRNMEIERFNKMLLNSLFNCLNNNP